MCATSMVCHRIWEDRGGFDAWRKEGRLGFLRGVRGSQRGAAGCQRGAADCQCGVTEHRPAAAGKAEEGAAASRP